MNPKDSHIYSIQMNDINTTPSGSHRCPISSFYIHQIPSGLKY